MFVIVAVGSSKLEPSWETLQLQEVVTLPYETSRSQWSCGQHLVRTFSQGYVSVRQVSFATVSNLSEERNRDFKTRVLHDRGICNRLATRSSKMSYSLSSKMLHVWGRNGLRNSAIGDDDDDDCSQIIPTFETFSNYICITRIYIASSVADLSSYHIYIFILISVA
jgi:hypothetical protein